MAYQLLAWNLVRGNQIAAERNRCVYLRLWIRIGEVIAVAQLDANAPRVEAGASHAVDRPTALSCVPRGVSVFHKLRNLPGLVDVVVARDWIERTTAAVQPVAVARSAPGGGVDDDAADGLRAASIVALARHTAPGDRWWRGVHGFSVPHCNRSISSASVSASSFFLSVRAIDAASSV